MAKPRIGVYFAAAEVMLIDARAEAEGYATRADYIRSVVLRSVGARSEPLAPLPPSLLPSPSLEEVGRVEMGFSLPSFEGRAKPVDSVRDILGLVGAKGSGPGGGTEGSPVLPGEAVELGLEEDMETEEEGI